ncbi:MAG: hypothetical protein ACLFUB_11845 [Cyclobacteriaceae bacterium]
MKFEEFGQSLKQKKPPAQLPPLLKAMWYDAQQDWDKAHDIAQDIDNREGAWVHAYLHRKEGDAFNAGYWYRRADKPPFEGSLQQEWEQIVKALL